MKRIALLAMYLLLFVNLSASAIDLRCWIMKDNNDNCGIESEGVSNLVARTNEIFSQVGMSFDIDSISFTNSTRLSHYDYDDDSLLDEIFDLCKDEDGIEVFFVSSLSGNVTAFQVSNCIVVGPSADRATLAHEIGHVCGLPDIYDESRDGTLVVAGCPTKERMPDDWGWYPEFVSQADIVKRLLMYGVQNAAKADISHGNVYGVFYTNVWNRVERNWDEHWQLGLAPVGFSGANRHLRSN